MKQKVKVYSDELKLKVVQEYYGTFQSQKELMLKYDILGPNTISDWIRKFGLKGPSQNEINLRKAMKKNTKETKLELELKAKILKLEKELSFKKLKSRAFNTLIDVAEEELKIDIRKKSGSKQ